MDLGSIKNKKIGWVLTGDIDWPSSRLQGHVIHDYFKKNKLNSHILVENFGDYEKRYSLLFFKTLRKILQGKFDVVFFQKPGWMMFKLSDVVRAYGVRTVAIQCDPFPGNYNDYFDQVVLTTPALKKALHVKTAIIIDDMIEAPRTLFKTGYTQTFDRLRLVWTGSGDRQLIENFKKEILAVPKLSDQVEISTIAHSSWADITWSRLTVHNDILAFDVAIIPVRPDDWYSTKSANRLTMFMSLGMPVIAGSIPAYKAIADESEACIIAKSMPEYVDAIVRLQLTEERRRFGEKARKYSWNNYSPDVIGRRWLSLLNSIVANSVRSMFPSYSILAGRSLSTALLAWVGFVLVLAGLPRRSRNSGEGDGRT